MTLCLAAAAAAMAQTTVDAKANIYAAGLASASDGVLPVLIPVNPTDAYFTFTASGLVNPFGGAPYVGPDGIVGATNINAANGLSGAVMPRQAPLVGVFLTGSPSAVAPAPINFNLLTVDFDLLEPGIAQVFFIGDGKYWGGSQYFKTPVGAERLYLGFADGFGFSGNPGFYSDNTGSLEVKAEAVPEPGLLLGAAAAAGLLGRRRVQKTRRS